MGPTMAAPGSGPDAGIPVEDSKTPIGERVYAELLSRVLSSQLGPDDRVTIDALGRELGVSQTPIREALHRLNADGLVVKTHLSGYRVAPKLTSVQFEDLVEIRLLLEPAAARRAAQHMVADQVVRLEAVDAEMAAQLTDDDAGRGYAAFSRLDAQFHDQVAEGGGNHFIRDSLSRLHTHAHLFRLANYAQITEFAVNEHQAILAAIRLRDPGEAAFAMRQHIDASAARFRKAFEQDAG